VNLHQHLLAGLPLLLLGLGCGESDEPYAHPFVVGDDVDSSPVSGEEDGSAAIEEEGWSPPVRLEVDDDGAEDSTYITRDGRYVLFYHVPTVGGDDTDPKIYYTERPFQTREEHPITSDDHNAEAGPYISEAGDIYYARTFIVLESGEAYEERPVGIVINDGTTLLDLGTGVKEGNPHYCDELDELYANTEHDSGDTDVVVSKDGVTTVLSEPINLADTLDLQPFLTDDCQTMYFTSSRGSTTGSFPLQVYKSERLGDFEWSEPELFVSHPQPDTENGIYGGVGEFSMTRDSQQMVYLELTITADGDDYVGTNDMYYADRD
jgi:hypothetical protein